MHTPTREFLRVLATTEASEFDALVASLDLDRVFAAFRGGPFVRDDRARLVHVLTVRRVADVRPETLAAVVHAMRSISQRRTFSRGIRAAFLSLTGEPFRAFKYALNATGDRHDLEHIVFQRLTADDKRVVLRKIAQEAAAHPSDDVRILSDIDDTVRCAIHDRRVPRGTVYPGVVQLLTELDRGAAAEPGRPGDLTFVTARPSGPRGLIEHYTRNELSELEMPTHSVLGGSFLNLFTKTLIGARKLQNFEHERRIFPECRLVFIGDSGQADAHVGARMLACDPRFVAAVLIHDVTAMTARERRALEREGIRVFETYAGAARHAQDAGLISAAGAGRVLAATLEGIAALPIDAEARAQLASVAQAEHER